MILGCLVLFCACGTGKNQVGPLSGLGENCTKTADCESGLKCVDFVCVEKPDDTGDSDATGPDGSDGGDSVDWSIGTTVCMAWGDFSAQKDCDVHAVLFGPPKQAFPDLAPFTSCSFVKGCYATADGTHSEGCQLFDFMAGKARMEDFPQGQEFVLDVDCMDSDGTGSPMNVVSRGQSVPLLHSISGDEEWVGVYMLPLAQFGPTLNGGSLQQEPSVQATFSTTPRHGAAAIELEDGSVLLAGGVKDLTATCPNSYWTWPTRVQMTLATSEIYQPADGTFSLEESTNGPVLMSEKRAFAAAVTLPDGEVAIFGGLGENGKPTNSVDLYDPFSNKMVPAPPMLDTRALHTATLISSAGNGFVLLAGGYGTGEGTWEVWGPDGVVASSNLIESRWGHTATLVTKKAEPAAREVVILAGGEGGGEPGSTTVRSTMEIFDINAQAFDPGAVSLCSNAGPNSPTPARKTLHAAAYVPPRHFIYMAGGFSDSAHQSPTKDICVWHTVQEKWVGEAGAFVMKSHRGALTATPLRGNAVLLAGGLAQKGQALQAAETVEIIFEYWNENGETVVDIGPGEAFPIPMLYPRWGHGALPTADGKVLIYGGVTKESPTAPAFLVEKTEVFNPM